MSIIQPTEPVIIRPEDIEPNWNWERPIAAPGRMDVDFEERVDFRRLHKYRVGRAQQALEKSHQLVLFRQLHGLQYNRLGSIKRHGWFSLGRVNIF